jgi:hypothetical protein
VSLLGSLFTGLSKGARRDRLGAKFVESEFEKVDRLLELFVKYEGQVAAAEATFRQQLQGTCDLPAHLSVQWSIRHRRVKRISHRWLGQGCQCP